MKYRLPVSSFVLLLTRRGLPKRAPGQGQIDAGDIQIRARFRLVRLWQVSARRMLTLNRESLLPFVPLMRGGQMELETGAQRLSEVVDERRRREMGLHFLTLGGLRYNREVLLDLIGRKSMIPIEQLKESSFYQYIAEIEQREALAKMLRLLIAKRFPGLNVAAEIERIHNAAVLQQLCVEMIDMPDAATLQKRLAEATESGVRSPESEV